MSDIVIYLKKQFQNAVYPVFILAFVLLAGECIALTGWEELVRMRDGLHAATGGFWAMSMPAFSVYFTAKNGKKALITAMCAAVADMAYYAVSACHLGFLAGLLMAGISVFIYFQFDFIQGFFLLFFSLLTIGILLAVSFEWQEQVLQWLCMRLGGKGALAGMVDYAYTVLFSERWGNLFYHKDYSGVVMTQNGIVSGAVDIFNQTKQEKAAFEYLSGRYFSTIFLPLGMAAALFPQMLHEKRAALITATALSVCFGDVRLFVWILLLYHPLLALAASFIVLLGYYTASLLHLGIGYTHGAGLFELFPFWRQSGYLLAAGVILLLLSYFAARFLLARYDFHSQHYYPKSVRRLLAALGGKENIERIREDKIIVYNPNLIDIIQLDCDIRENCVTLFYDDYALLKEYF